MELRPTKELFREGACSDVVNFACHRKFVGSASTVPMPRAPGKIRAGPLSTGEQELAGHR